MVWIALTICWVTWSEGENQHSTGTPPMIKWWVCCLFGVAKTAVRRIGNGLFATPHFVEFQLVCACERLVLDKKRIVKIGAHVGGSPVHGAAHYPGLLRQTGVDDHKLVVHQRHIAHQYRKRRRWT